MNNKYILEIIALIYYVMPKIAFSIKDVKIFHFFVHERLKKSPKAEGADSDLDLFSKVQ